jgi:hypothetical protein
MEEYVNGMMAERVGNTREMQKKQLGKARSQRALLRKI